VEEPDDFEFLGTLVFRIPVDRIDAILTGRGRWAGMGLGQTGEIYLVGTDKRMRSIARGAVEDSAARRASGNSPVSSAARCWPPTPRSRSCRGCAGPW